MWHLRRRDDRSGEVPLVNTRAARRRAAARNAGQAIHDLRLRRTRAAQCQLMRLTSAPIRAEKRSGRLSVPFTKNLLKNAVTPKSHISLLFGCFSHYIA